MKRFPRAAAAAVLAVLVVAAAAGFLAGPAGAQADGSGQLVLEGVDSSGFPLVRAVVSGPKLEGELDDAFSVVENGEEIEPDVVRLRSNGLNVVVAIDVSTSMKGGDAIGQAKAAVGELLATLPEGVPVSIVTFGDAAIVQSGFTVDREATMASVNQVIAAGGTALYDGINLGLQQLENQGGTGALIVLADGDDSASAATIEDTTDALATSSVRASFVALETESFRPDAIEAIAGAANGSVLSIDGASQFTDALRDVALGLGNLYEIRWRSASSGDSADLEIALASDPSQAVSTNFAHDAVTSFVPDIALDTRTVASPGILGASWLPIVAALCVTVGAAVLFMMSRNTEAAAERRQERIAGKQEKVARRKNALTDVQGRLNDFSAQMLQANDRGRSLDDRLDRAGLAVRSNEFVVFCVGLLVASLLFGVVMFGIPYFLLGALLPAVGIPLFLRIATNRRRKKFVNQLGDTLQLIHGSLTAGYGLGQTLDSVAREAESPTSDEFSRVVMETRLGRSLEDALDAMSKRIQAPDFDWVVDAIKIQSSVGGNLSEIIEQVGDTIRVRVRIKRQVDALTAEGKISALVLFVLPFGLMGFIGATNPSYLAPLFSGGVGYVMIGTALTMLSIGGLWLKKLVSPEF
jgi:tight adherence protein B